MKVAQSLDRNRLRYAEWWPTVIKQDIHLLNLVQIVRKTNRLLKYFYFKLRFI